MSLKIKANSFAIQRYLEVDSAGVKFCETAALGGVKRFRFDQIENILMSSEQELSFQVGLEVFKIPIKTANKKHQAVLQALLQEVRRTG